MQPKPGYQSSELWLTLAGIVLATLVSMGKISPEQSQTYQAAFAAALVHVAALAAIVGPVVGYLWVRFVLKKQATPPVLPAAPADKPAA